MATKKIKGYTIVRASALAQMEVLSVISANVMSRWMLCQEPVDKPVDNFLLPLVISLPFSQKQRLIELLMSNITDKDGVYADIENFNEKMVEWHELIAEVLYWNLNDFFTYIDTAHRSDLSNLKIKA